MNRVLLTLLLASPLAAQCEWLRPFAEPELKQNYVRAQTGGGLDTNPGRVANARTSAFLEGRADAQGEWDVDPFTHFASFRSGLRRPLAAPEYQTWDVIVQGRTEISGGTGVKYRAGVSGTVGWEMRPRYEVFDLPTRQLGLELMGGEARLDFSLAGSGFGFGVTLWAAHHAFSRESTRRTYDPADSVFPGLQRPILRPLDYTSVGGTFWPGLSFSGVVDVGPYFWMEGRYFTDQRPIGAFGVPAEGRMRLLRVEFGSRAQVVASDAVKFIGGWFVRQGDGGGPDGKDAIVFWGGGYRLALEVNLRHVALTSQFEYSGRTSNVGSEFQELNQEFLSLRAETRVRPVPWFEFGINAALNRFDCGEFDLDYVSYEAQIFIAAGF